MNAHPDLAFFLDTNCVNARQNNAALNELERWREQGCVTLMYSETTHAEARYGSAERAKKADEFSFASLNQSSIHNPDVLRAIEAILCPHGARTQNEFNDVLAVYMAERVGWPLVTMDGASKRQPGGILGRSKQLEEIGVEVITPEVAVDRLRSQCIAPRSVS